MTSPSVQLEFHTPFSTAGRTQDVLADASVELVSVALLSAVAPDASVELVSVALLSAVAPVKQIVNIYKVTNTFSKTHRMVLHRVL
jgi:hypothetical protein